MTLLIAQDRMQGLAPDRLRLRICAHCNQPTATRLCDWPGAGGRTPCDKFLCDACATAPGPGKDLCRQHAERWSRHKAQGRGRA